MVNPGSLAPLAILVLILQWRIPTERARMPRLSADERQHGRFAARDHVVDGP